MCRTIADEGQNLFVKEKCVALDILADVASRALQQEEEKVKEKEKEATWFTQSLGYVHQTESPIFFMTR